MDGPSVVTVLRGRTRTRRRASRAAEQHTRTIIPTLAQWLTRSMLSFDGLAQIGGCRPDEMVPECEVAVAAVN